MDGEYAADGAVCVNKKYLDGAKSDTAIEFSYGEIQNRIVLRIKGDMEAVVMPKEMDAKMFYETLEYEYAAPQKPVTEPQITEPEKPAIKPAKAKRTPKVQKVNGAFTGWTYNRLGTKQVKVCNW
jgi:hypothetical protein